MTTATPPETQALVGKLFETGLAMLEGMNIYLGQRMGYYTALKGAKSGLTPADLALKTGTHERYAREWLEQQAAAGLLEVTGMADDPAKRRFRMPTQVAEVLTEPMSLNYLMPLFDMIGVLGTHTEKLVNAYKTGGGVSWAELGKEVREAQAAFNRPMFMSLLASTYLPSIPDIHGKLSRSDARVADIACGGGWSSIGIAKGYPNVRVDGFDIDGPSVEMARENAQAERVSDRVQFHEMDAADATGTYDLVLICEALHDMPQPVPVLQAARRMAGSEGAVVVMDERVADKFEAPANEIDRFMYAISTWVCLPDSMSHQPSVATGTVMRPGTLKSTRQRPGSAISKCCR